MNKIINEDELKLIKQNERLKKRVKKLEGIIIEQRLLIGQLKGD